MSTYWISLVTLLSGILNECGSFSRKTWNAILVTDNIPLNYLPVFTVLK